MMFLREDLNYVTWKRLNAALSFIRWFLVQLLLQLMQPKTECHLLAEGHVCIEEGSDCSNVLPVVSEDISLPKTESSERLLQHCRRHVSVNDVFHWSASSNSFTYCISHSTTARTETMNEAGIAILPVHCDHAELSGGFQTRSHVVLHILTWECQR